MLVWGMRGRALPRVTAAGLSLGVLTLAGLAAWSTASSSSATAQLRRLDDAGTRWTRLLLTVDDEDRALTGYLLSGLPVEAGTTPTEPGSAASVAREAARLKVQRTVGSADPELAGLRALAPGVSPADVTAVTRDYRRYTVTVQELLALGSDGDPGRVVLLGGEASVRAEGLRGSIVTRVQGMHEAEVAFLAQVHVRDRRLRLAEWTILGGNASLLAVSALMLLAGQHRIERQDERSDHQALHDELTGLPNRVGLQERVQTAMRDGRRTDERCALLLLDLDRFREVNDRLGHYYGDLLLREVANRLRTSLRDGDTVARLGGDEFAVLLRRVRTTDHVLAVAERALDELRRPVNLQGSVVVVGGSIGVALAPEHGDDAGELLRLADIAMYEAKRGRTGVQLYRPAGDAGAGQEELTASELAAAIDAGQLVLHYQPKLAVNEGRIDAVEALVRWQHPHRGLLGPDLFVPVAEKSDLILSLTDKVLDIALADQRAWQERGLRLSVAVNVGVRSLLVHDLADRIGAALRRHGTDPGDLMLEITETAFISDLDRAMRVLGQLRELGVHISIDDFGTGYSSMTYLQALPADELKIDRGFIGSMRGERSEAIVRATVQLGHSLGLLVVAEGVEDDETLRQVQQIGCDSAQGYGICRPMPSARLLDWLGRTSWSVGHAPSITAPPSITGSPPVGPRPGGPAPTGI